MNNTTLEKNTTSEALETAETEKAYTYRKLCTADVFPMFRIISKIGVNEFSACFEKESVQRMIAAFAAKKTRDFDISSVVGASVILDVANIIFTNLPKCENEIYDFLASISGLKVEKIKGFEMYVFAEMIIDLVKKEEFKDFFKVVSRLFK